MFWLSDWKYKSLSGISYVFILWMVYLRHLTVKKSKPPNPFTSAERILLCDTLVYECWLLPVWQGRNLRIQMDPSPWLSYFTSPKLCPFPLAMSLGLLCSGWEKNSPFQKKAMLWYKQNKKTHQKTRQTNADVCCFNVCFFSKIPFSFLWYTWPSI